MKKIITLSLATLLCVFCLAGCGKFECDLCKEEKSGEKHKEKVDGKEIVMCDDCYEELEELANALS